VPQRHFTAPRGAELAPKSVFLEGRFGRLQLTRFALSFAFVVGGFSVAAGPAQAVPCGEIDPVTKRPAKASITLDEKSAVTNLIFKRSTAKRTLSLIFTVTGCELDTLEPPPLVRVLPSAGANELPDQVISLLDADAEDGSVFYLRLRVDPSKFEPGTYGGLVVARAPYVATNRTPITVSRTERPWIPAGIGAFSGLVGLLWFLALKFFAREKLQISWRWLFLLIPLAVGAGAWAAGNLYWDQDVWTFDENWRAAARAGAAGASTGSLGAVLVTIWKSPTKTAGP
jgi:hypothetical protein